MPDPDVVSAVLGALSAYLRKPHHSLLRWQAPAQLTARLLHMSRGWGGKEEVRCAGGFRSLGISDLTHKAFDYIQL